MVVRSAERTQFLYDIMATALEGGVNYWSAADDVERGDPDKDFYRSYVLYCTDGGRESVECGANPKLLCTGHKVDPDVIARGLGLGTVTEAVGNEKEIGWHYNQRKHVILANRENDAGEIDAGDADCIVQLGVFGKVIYG